VRIIKWSNDGTSEKKSLSVIRQTLPQLKISSEETKNRCYPEVGKATLKINKLSGNVEYLSNSGDEILKEKGEALFKTGCLQWR